MTPPLGSGASRHSQELERQMQRHVWAEGKIDGLVIRAVGERPPGTTEEFLAWARKNEPEELDELMPGGEIDPSGDHAERFRRLLNRWRMASGRDPIE